MLQFNLGKDQAGNPVVVGTVQDAIKAVDLMRAMKRAFPDHWKQVNMELFVPNAPDVDTKRLVEANGGL